MNLVQTVQELMRPLARRVANLVSRGFVRGVDDSRSLQTLQVETLAGETRDDVERLQPYGFTSVPRAGSEAVVVFLGGNRDHGLAIAVDDRQYRLSNLNGGEVAIYNDTGAKVVLKASGDIEVTPAAGKTIALAGSAASVARGEALNSAISTLGSAIAGALTTMGAGGATPMPGALAVTAGSTIGTAVTAFNSAAASALSTKVKLP